MLGKASSSVWGWEGDAYIFYQSLLHLFATEEEVLSAYSCGSTLCDSEKKHSFRHLANTLGSGDSLRAKVLAEIEAKQ